MEIRHFSVRQNNNLIVLTDLHVHVFIFGQGFKNSYFHTKNKYAEIM